MVPEILYCVNVARRNSGATISLQQGMQQLACALVMSVIAMQLLVVDVECRTPSEEYDVVEFSLRYGRSVRTSIPVVVKDDNFFLDVVAMTEDLGGTVEGEGRDLEVLLGSDDLTLRLDGSKTSAIIVQGRTYVPMEILRQLRPLRFDVSLSDLTVYISSSQPLPVDRAGLALLRRSRIRNEAIPFAIADTTVEPERVVVGGATLNYRLWVQHAMRSTVFGSTLSGGWAVGLGALELDLQANLLHGQLAIDGVARWSYRSPQGVSLTMLDIGLLTDRRLSVRPIIGLSCSNAPASSLSVVGYQQVTLDLEPGQQADLYAGRRYLGSINDTSRHVIVPSLLGTQYVTAELFDQDGGTASLRLPIRNDQQAVKAGRLVYDVVVGADSRGISTDGRAALRYSPLTGAVAWLSVRTRHESDTLATIGEVGASVMLSASTVLRGTYHPSIVASTSLTGIGPSGASYSVQARFYGARAFVLSELTGDRPRTETHRSAFAVRAVWPIGGVVNGSVDVLGTADAFEREDIRYAAALQASAATSSLSLSARLRSEYLGGSLQSIITARLGLRLPDMPSLGWITNGLTIRAEVLSRIDDRIPLAATLGLSRAFRVAGIRFHAAATSELSSKLVQLSIEASRDVGAVAVQTSATAVGSTYQTRSALSGSIRFDASTNEVSASRMTVANSAGIAIRFFVDENDDRKYQDNEEIIDGISIVVDGGTMRPDVGRGYVVITDLPPASEFLVSVDASTIPDPTLAIRHLEYSVVTEAHHVRAIEIPLVRSSTVEGRLLSSNGKPVSVRGSTVVFDSDVLRQPRSCRVASDGSFALAGLPPGMYRVSANGFAQSEVRVVRSEGSVSVDLLPLQ